MNTKKLSKVVDSKTAKPAPLGGKKVGDDQHEALISLFSKDSKTANPLRANRVSDSDEIIALRAQVKHYRKKVKDAEEKAQEYQDLVAIYRREKDEALQQISDLSEKVEAARAIQTPFTMTYNSQEGIMKLGTSEATEVTNDQFKEFIDSICLVFPEMKVSVTVDDLSGTADEVRAKIKKDAESGTPKLQINDTSTTPLEWTKEGFQALVDACKDACKDPTDEKKDEAKRIADQYCDPALSAIVDSFCNAIGTDSQEALENTIQAYLAPKSQEFEVPFSFVPVADSNVSDSTVAEAAQAITKLLDEWDPSALDAISEDGLPENIKAIVTSLKKRGYLEDGEYDLYAEGAKKELEEAGASIPSFALLSDSVVNSTAALKEALKAKGISDSVLSKIPGTPSMYRVSDSQNKHGFSVDASVLEVEEGKYIIYE